MSNRPVHFEIQSSDPERDMAFYKAVFGWEFVDAKMPIPYWLIMTAAADSTEKGINGGLLKRNSPMPKDGEGVNAFYCTMQVENIDETIKKLEAAGARVALPKMAMTGMAWLAYYKDLDGNLFGVYQEDKNAK